MATIVPTVTADNLAQYDEQLVKACVGERLHIDMADGSMAPRTLVGPAEAHWPEGKTIDLHVMYRRPAAHIPTLIALKPQLVILHAEADDNLRVAFTELRDAGIRTGLSLLQETPIEALVPYEELLDHVLIFSGHLGEFGGEAELELLTKVRAIKNRWPELEVGWDGGINDQNVAELARAGVDALNTGGFIQHASSPQEAYAILSSKISAQ